MTKQTQDQAQPDTISGSTAHADSLSPARSTAHVGSLSPAGSTAHAGSLSPAGSTAHASSLSHVEVMDLKERIIAGHRINKDEALHLYHAPLDALTTAADQLRRHFNGDGFDMCTIINAKSGRCSEDCSFCAQSAHYHTGAESYPLLDPEAIRTKASSDASRGVLRFSLVTSGRKLSSSELRSACKAISLIKNTVDIDVCVSFGLMGQEDFKAIKAAGATRVHCNLEASRSYFPQICTTHTYDEKLATLNAAREAGLSICSGGIMGLGESIADRIDMALDLRELGVRSIPVNFLAPIAGTPLQDRSPLDSDTRLRIVAVYRFIIPEASIRLAGGRGIMPDHGEGCFRSGANAAISGDMLTTAGFNVETDRVLLSRLGYHLRKDD